MSTLRQSLHKLTLETAEVGWRAFDAKDYSAALAFFEPWRDDRIGQYFIGLIYLNDEKFKDRRDEGVALLKLSAETDFDFAWLALGNYYAAERHGIQDLKQAISWYAKGAEYGCSSCQTNLGWCYCRFEEFVQASKWLFISAVLGAEQGRHLFNLLFVKATSEQYDEGCRQAIEWLERKIDADEGQVHSDLRNWLVRYRESSESVLSELARIRVW